MVKWKQNYVERKKNENRIVYTTAMQGPATDFVAFRNDYDKCILLSFPYRLLIQKLEGGILEKLICWFHLRKISLLQWGREVINWEWDAVARSKSQLINM